MTQVKTGENLDLWTEQQHSLEAQTATATSAPRPLKIDPFLNRLNTTFPEFIEHYRALHMGQRETAEILGISSRYLRILCVREGIEPLGKGDPDRWRHSTRKAPTREAIMKSADKRRLIIEHEGRKLTVKAWAAVLGITEKTFYNRYRTWGMEATVRGSRFENIPVKESSDETI